VSNINYIHFKALAYILGKLIPDKEKEGLNPLFLNNF